MYHSLSTRFFFLFCNAVTLVLVLAVYHQHPFPNTLVP